MLGEGNDLGTATLGSTLTALAVVGNSAGTPSDPPVAPIFRVYGQAGTLLNNGFGSLTKIDTGTITGATNASPLAITTASPHGLITGTRVSISGVGGNTAANVETPVTVVDATHFTLDGVTGNGAYTSGGTWHTSGLYSLSLPLNGGDGYVAGGTYQVLVSWTSVTGQQLGMLCPFRVV